MNKGDFLRFLESDAVSSSFRSVQFFMGPVFRDTLLDGPIRSKVGEAELGSVQEWVPKNGSHEKRDGSAALEATQGRNNSFFSQLPYKCYLDEVASVGD